MHLFHTNMLFEPLLFPQQLMLSSFLFFFFPQDAQVTVECVITQKFHRSIMGPKGSRIQQITRDHNVQIKFPEREDLQSKTPGPYEDFEIRSPNVSHVLIIISLIL